MTGVINTIKEALPNFEEDQIDVFSSLNSYQSDTKFNTEEPSNTLLPKSSRLSLLPDFFTTSTSGSPAGSPLIEKAHFTLGDISGNMKEPPCKIGFTFSAGGIQVYK